MTGKHLWAVFSALVAAATAGCSGNASDDPPTPTTTSTSSSSSPSTTPAPTPEDEATAAALASFDGYWDVSQAYAQAPAARNWEPELRRYADDAATAGDLSTIQNYLAGATRQEGEYTVDPTVTSIDLVTDPQPTVMIMVCFDSRQARTVYVATGEPTPDPPPDLRPKFPRWELRVTVLGYPEQEGSPWLVHDFEALTDVQC